MSRGECSVQTKAKYYKKYFVLSVRNGSCEKRKDECGAWIWHCGDKRDDFRTL